MRCRNVDVGVIESVAAAPGQVIEASAEIQAGIRSKPDPEKVPTSY